MTENSQIAIDFSCFGHDGVHSTCVENETTSSLLTQIQVCVSQKDLHDTTILNEVTIVKPAIATCIDGHVIWNHCRNLDIQSLISTEFLNHGFGIIEESPK